MAHLMCVNANCTYIVSDAISKIYNTIHNICISIDIPEFKTNPRFSLFFQVIIIQTIHLSLIANVISCTNAIRTGKYVSTLHFYHIFKISPSLPLTNKTKSIYIYISESEQDLM